MQFTTTLLAALASTAITASPLVFKTRQDTQSQIETSITNWFNDIVAVNTFLNNLASGASTDPASDAANLLPIVQDEPIELGNLGALLASTDAGAQGIVSVLMANFPTVPTAVTNIINSNNNPNIVRANAAVINSIRCALVLKSIGGLWENVNADNGMSPVAFPPGPDVCPFADGNGDYAVVSALL